MRTKFEKRHYIPWGTKGSRWYHAHVRVVVIKETPLYNLKPLQQRKSEKHFSLYSRERFQGDTHELEVVGEVKLLHHPEPHDVKRREYPTAASLLLVRYFALLLKNKQKQYVWYTMRRTSCRWTSTKKVNIYYILQVFGFHIRRSQATKKNRDYFSSFLFSRYIYHTTTTTLHIPQFQFGDISGKTTNHLKFWHGVHRRLA